MEEVVGTLSTCISSRPDWPYALAQLYEGSNHTPLPKDKHIGVLPWGKMEESPYGQISQIKVCQLLSARTWVFYLVCLIGGDQPVTITLPEPLHSGSSITTNEHPHMGINIPPISPEEPECTTLPLGRANTIPAIATPKTPWKPRISLRAEVDALQKQDMADDSSHKSEHSATEKAAAADAVISLTHKVEVLAMPIDTSSQVSVEEGEASLESNPVNVSPTMAANSSHSGSLTVNLTKLQTDTNLLVDHMISVRRSTDLKRQQITWELGLQLCQNKANEAVANERAKILHSWEILDARVDCTKAVLEAKNSYRAAIQEAKTIWGNQFQKNRSSLFQGPWWEHCHEVLSICYTPSGTYKAYAGIGRTSYKGGKQESAWLPFCLSSHPASCSAVTQGEPDYLLPHLIRASPSWSPSAPPTRTSPLEEQPSMAASPKPIPQLSPWPKRWHPSPELQESMSVDETSQQATQEGPTSSKKQGNPTWFTSLKPSWAEAFSQESDIVKEARIHFFSNHPYHWAHDGTNDLSNIFKGLAESTGLLGEAIHEIQLSWTGPTIPCHSCPKV